MGSIQSLKSWALATRANEDTDLQTSGHIGNINKTLGSQILDMIDRLQGVISQRTKAYNSLVNSINKQVEGKDGIGPKVAIAGITATRSLFASVGGIIGAVKDGGSTSAALYAVAGAVTSLISSWFQGQSLKHSANAIVYDYEKMASQLGYYQSTRTFPDDPTTTIDESKIVEISDMVSGASMYLDLRDGLMPRYYQNRMDDSYNYAPGRGYIGTLRRM